MVPRNNNILDVVRIPHRKGSFVAGPLKSFGSQCCAALCSKKINNDDSGAVGNWLQCSMLVIVTLLCPPPAKNLHLCDVAFCYPPPDFWKKGIGIIIPTAAVSVSVLSLVPYSLWNRTAILLPSHLLSFLTLCKHVDLIYCMVGRPVCLCHVTLAMAKPACDLACLVFEVCFVVTAIKDQSQNVAARACCLDAMLLFYSDFSQR